MSCTYAAALAALFLLVGAHYWDAYWKQKFLWLASLAGRLAHNPQLLVFLSAIFGSLATCVRRLPFALMSLVLPAYKCVSFIRMPFWLFGNVCFGLRLDVRDATNYPTICHNYHIRFLTKKMSYNL